MTGARIGAPGAQEGVTIPQLNHHLSIPGRLPRNRASAPPQTFTFPRPSRPRNSSNISSASSELDRMLENLKAVLEGG